MVERSGFAFLPGGEPPESDVAPIRERLPVAPPEEASVLGNRELFARLAASAMLPAMERACSQWRPTATKAVLANASYRDHASHIAAEMAAAPTAGDVLDQGWLSTT
jgi:hypothetical protein